MTWTKEIPANPVVAVAGHGRGGPSLQVLHDADFGGGCARWHRLARRRRSCRSWVAARFRQASLRCSEMTPESFEGVDIALFSCGAMSKEMREAVKPRLPP